MATIVTRIAKGSPLTYAEADANWTNLNDELGTVAGLAGSALQPGDAIPQADVTGLVAALAGKAPTAHGHAIADVTGLQGALDGKQSLSAVLTATTASFTTADETKLDGIAAGATANSSDATLLARANHTGTQAQSTVTGLVGDLAGKQETLVSGTNIKTVNGNSLLGSGDVVVSGGGGATATQITLTVSSVALGYAEVIHADAAVTGVSKIMADFAPSLDAENDLESMADNGLRVWPIPEAGQVRFVLTGNGAFVGPFTINYQVAA